MTSENSLNIIKQVKDKNQSKIDEIILKYSNIFEPYNQTS